ncbi:MAG TPA: alkaline phosphatase family protein [Gemmatimonadales bacterium]|nr:alkaline phosphatase family protein [Gemmatimonadales bacterium]
MRHLILALTDGLRPDAITPTVMPSLHALAGAYTSATAARTVRPSATVAALASLATGVGPETHRLVQPGLDFLPRLGRLRPVARELARHGVPADVVTAELPLASLPVAWALASAAGVRRLLPAGRRARDTAAGADWLAREDGSSLVFVYLPDCDDAGHEHGWMSDRYLAAAVELDAAIGVLSRHVDDALLVVVADHGGGGVLATEHHHPHPVNEHIPLVLAGPGVAREQRLEGPVSILDLSATVLWWFGAPIPDCYEGRPLLEAFAPELAAQESAP